MRYWATRAAKIFFNEFIKKIQTLKNNKAYNRAFQQSLLKGNQYFSSRLTSSDSLLQIQTLECEDIISFILTINESKADVSNLRPKFVMELLFRQTTLSHMLQGIWQQELLFVCFLSKQNDEHVFKLYHQVKNYRSSE